jgi:HD-GYP domain-containing protein (c-di-GMP phosphodiesterase class II)
MNLEFCITAAIVLGSILMVVNIVRYFLFIKNSHDVLSAGSARDRVWKTIAGVLLVFFLFGYLFSAFIGDPDIVMAMILFGGSIFVAIVLTLMFNLIETAKSRSIDIAEVLVGVIDARDPNLNGHSRHVQRITMLFYNYLPPHLKRGINPVSLEYAALMHDVGKLGVPEAILNKPAKLEPDEWAVMRRHPKVGVKILEPLQTFKHITDWILYHHERIDGHGYYSQPGDKIPLAARIISIADTYSAITMRRSYKAPKTHEDAIQIIKEVAGTQLDAELVKYFLTVPKEELAKCIPEQVKY